MNNMYDIRVYLYIVARPTSILVFSTNIQRYVNKGLRACRPCSLGLSRDSADNFRAEQKKMTPFLKCIKNLLNNRKFFYNGCHCHFLFLLFPPQIITLLLLPLDSLFLSALFSLSHSLAALFFFFFFIKAEKTHREPLF